MVCVTKLAAMSAKVGWIKLNDICLFPRNFFGTIESSSKFPKMFLNSFKKIWEIWLIVWLN